MTGNKKGGRKKDFGYKKAGEGGPRVGCSEDKDATCWLGGGCWGGLNRSLKDEEKPPMGLKKEMENNLDLRK